MLCWWCVCVCVCRCRMYSFMGGGLFCAGVGNILLIVSTATDYWMQYRQSSNYMHQGLWRYCMPGKCFPHSDSIGESYPKGFKWSLEILPASTSSISERWSFYSGKNNFIKTNLNFFFSTFPTGNIPTFCKIMVISIILQQLVGLYDQIICYITLLKYQQCQQLNEPSITIQ